MEGITLLSSRRWMDGCSMFFTAHFFNPSAYKQCRWFSVTKLFGHRALESLCDIFCKFQMNPYFEEVKKNSLRFAAMGTCAAFLSCPDKTDTINELEGSGLSELFNESRVKTRNSVWSVIHSNPTGYIQIFFKKNLKQSKHTKKSVEENNKAGTLTPRTRWSGTGGRGNTAKIHKEVCFTQVKHIRAGTSMKHARNLTKTRKTGLRKGLQNTTWWEWWENT